MGRNKGKFTVITGMGFIFLVVHRQLASIINLSTYGYYYISIWNVAWMIIFSLFAIAVFLGRTKIAMFAAIGEVIIDTYSCIASSKDLGTDDVFNLLSGIAMLLAICLAAAHNSLVGKIWFLPTVFVLFSNLLDFSQTSYRINTSAGMGWRHFFNVAGFLMNLACFTLFGLWCKKAPVLLSEKPLWRVASGEWMLGLSENNGGDPGSGATSKCRETGFPGNTDMGTGHGAASGDYGGNPSENAGIGGADRIRACKELLDCGAITREEFNMKKRQILGL